MPSTCAATVHPIRGADLVDIEKRYAARQPCVIEATSRPLEAAEGLTWGGAVKDVSVGGLKLCLCFPFRPGTYLAIDLQPASGPVQRSLLCRVVHVHDQADGTWTLGCEFLKPLTARAVELLR
jgi:PilZ domain